ncbi:hypothetical protein AT984_04680 [Paucibacter sp. KCTC 42545]|nr:hypothetical protein AT984_04680 [Paucibacter sp. KCTC 42545]
MPGPLALGLAMSQGPGAGFGHVMLLAWFGLLILVLVAGAAFYLSRQLTRQALGHSLGVLRAQNQRWEQLLAKQADGRWHSDPQHRLLSWHVNGAEPLPATGQPCWERFGLLSLEGSADAEGLQALLKQQPAEIDCRVQALAGDGGNWDLLGLACWDEQGQFQGYQGVAKKLAVIDEQAMAAGAAVMLAQAQTQKQVSEQAQANLLQSQLQSQLQAQAFEAQEQASFSYTVSHDLRAPLRVVEGFARILKEDYGRLLDRIGNDHLDRVMGAASRMNSMIDSLLSLSQLSSQPLARQPVNLSQLADLVLDELQRSAPQRKVTVHIQPLMTTQGDPVLLRMVLENLLGNAWKYSSKCEQAEIRFEAQRDGPGPWIFRISDNGAGFDMRYADRLFGVFQRLHSASDFQGTGVGLASVRRIVRRHGGEVWAESEVGAGAKFYFTLPA